MSITRYSNPHLIPDKTVAMMSDKDRKAMGLMEPWERKHKAGVEIEKELQRQCESWLTLHGFRRRTPDDICRSGDCAGWFIHIYEAKRNPILLDLLILFSDGHYREIELKSRCGKPSIEQDNLIQRGGLLCRTLEEFIKIIEQK